MSQQLLLSDDKLLHTPGELGHSIACALRHAKNTSAMLLVMTAFHLAHQDRCTNVRRLRSEAASRFEQWLKPLGQR